MDSSLLSATVMQRAGGLECAVAVALNPRHARLHPLRPDHALGAPAVPPTEAPCSLPWEPLLAARVPAPTNTDVECAHFEVCASAGQSGISSTNSVSSKLEETSSLAFKKHNTQATTSAAAVQVAGHPFSSRRVQAHLWRVTMVEHGGVAGPLEGRARGMGGEHLAPFLWDLAVGPLLGASPAAARKGDGGRRGRCNCVEASLLPSASSPSAKAACSAPGGPSAAGLERSGEAPASGAARCPQTLRLRTRGLCCLPQGAAAAPAGCPVRLRPLRGRPRRPRPPSSRSRAALAPKLESSPRSLARALSPHSPLLEKGAPAPVPVSWSPHWLQSETGAPPQPGNRAGAEGLSSHCPAPSPPSSAPSPPHNAALSPASHAQALQLPSPLLANPPQPPLPSPAPPLPPPFQHSPLSSRLFHRGAPFPALTGCLLRRLLPGVGSTLRKGLCFRSCISGPCSSHWIRSAPVAVADAPALPRDRHGGQPPSGLSFALGWRCFLRRSFAGASAEAVGASSVAA